MSLRTATTFTSKSPLLSMASLSILTASSPTTPGQLKDFVHEYRMPTLRPRWVIGKEKVKPGVRSGGGGKSFLAARFLNVQFAGSGFYLGAGFSLLVGGCP